MLPAGLLVLALLGILIKDWFWTPQGGGDNVPIDRNSPVELQFLEREVKAPGQPDFPLMVFGLKLKGRTKDAAAKKLTFDEYGRTNNTVIRIDGKDYVFGLTGSGGKWVLQKGDLGSGAWGKKSGARSIWAYDNGVQVTQIVEVIPGDPIDVKGGGQKRYLDTLLIRYLIENKDKAQHAVGVRIMIDTLIGSNDGVPFAVPGEAALVDTQKDFPTKESVPDFIQACENPDLKNPGTVAQVGLKVGGKLEPPTRVSLTHWPHPNTGVRWDVPMENIVDDSAVVVYWNDQVLEPGQSREVGITYGRGHPSSGDGTLGLTVAGTMAAGGTFSVLAQVSEPKEGQTVTLTLPEGLKLVDGQLTQPVPPLPKGAANRISPVTWRVRAAHAGTFDVTVRSSTGGTQKKRIVIKSRSIF
jgi:hypothetical protein